MMNDSNVRAAKPPLLLGAHLSIAGGYDRAIGLAGRLGCNCVQIFVKNQRQWEGPAISDEQAAAWRSALASSRPRVERVVGHSAYLINLGSDDVVVRGRSIAALADELGRCRRLGVGDLVMHPGSHRGRGVEEGIRLVAKGLDEVLAADGGETRVLLETTAGAGGLIGSVPEEIAEVMAASRHPERLGFCMDSCHLFAAGFDVADRRVFDGLMARFEKLVGLERLGCVHLNDSAGELGSRLDRHAHIGEGRIGLAAFGHFVRDERLVGVPKVIETPKGDDLTFDRRNLRLLRKLAEEGHGQVS